MARFICLDYVSSLMLFFSSPEKALPTFCLKDKGFGVLGSWETRRGKVLGVSAYSMHRLTYSSFWYRISAHNCAWHPLIQRSVFYPLLRINFQTSAGVREGSLPMAWGEGCWGVTEDLLVQLLLKQLSNQSYFWASPSLQLPISIGTWCC